MLGKKMLLNIENHVRQAKQGDKKALETVVAQIQDLIYGLALRMMAHPQDAEDESQEILIKIITHLGVFREECAFSSWVYRIACNHLLTALKNKNRLRQVNFESLENALSHNPDTGFVSDGFLNPEKKMLLEEVRVGCMQGLLSCLDADTRAAYILGDLFEVSGSEGAYILDISPQAFRKRVSRGRKRIQKFMIKNCGLVNKNNPCRCERHLLKNMEKVISDNSAPAGMGMNPMDTNTSRAMDKLEELSELQRVTFLFRTYPRQEPSYSFVDTVKKLIHSGEYGIFME